MSHQKKVLIWSESAKPPTSSTLKRPQPRLRTLLPTHAGRSWKTDVWAARQDLAEAIASVSGIYNPQQAYKEWTDGKTTVSPPVNIFGREQADTLNRMLRASYYIDKSAGTLRDLLMVEQFRRGQVLTIDQFQGLYGRVILLSFDLQQAMQCQLAHVVLDQPVRTDGPGRQVR
jgi:hypothetical protein